MHLEFPVTAVVRFCLASRTFKCKDARTYFVGVSVGIAWVFSLLINDKTIYVVGMCKDVPRFDIIKT